MATREVLLTGSVPFKSAAEVFATASNLLGELMTRVPDGEQGGWVDTLRQRIAEHEAFEPSAVSRIGGEKTFTYPIQLYRLKPGYRTADIEFGDMGIARTAIASYRSFVELKAAGKIPSYWRFQVTIPGPATSGGTLQLPEQDVLPLMERMLGGEIKKILAAIPHDELTIQLDLAVEVEKEEFDRRPYDFNTPVFEIRRFTLAGTTDSARLVSLIPLDVEFGLHLCAMWHLYKAAGQDLGVHVDYANMLVRKISRPITYMHLPTTPEFGEAEFAPLRRLKCARGTKLFLGLLHAEDGIEGARRRITTAQKYYQDFGIGNFCGLSQWGATAASVVPMLELHRTAASL